MRHLLVTLLWFAVGCLCTGVIADTMQRRAEAAPIDAALALQTRSVQTVALQHEPGPVNAALRPKTR